MLKKYFIIPLLLLFLSCGSSEKNQYFEKVMEIHDDVMPKTSEIAKLSRYFEEFKRNKEIDSIQLNLADKMINQLEEAHESMMVWMNDFNVPDEKNKVIEYLMAEETKIKAVKSEMLQAISDAETLRNNLNAE